MYKFEEAKLMRHISAGNLQEALENSEAMIAGGAITSIFCNRDINDIDIYFRSKKHALQFVEEMEGRCAFTHVSSKAVMFHVSGVECQIVSFKYFDTPDDIFKTFDYTCCMGAYDFKTKSFVLHPDFLRHNSQRILSFNQNTAYPFISAIRLEKYKDRGYTISKPEHIKVLMACAGCDISTAEQFKEQVGGMYGYDVSALIQKCGEYSKEKMFDVLTSLDYNENVFDAETHEIEIDDVCDALNGTPYIDKYFTHIGLGYKLTRKCIKRMPDYDRDDKIQTLEQFCKGRKLYKWVKQNPGGLTSFYDPSFVYEVGSEIMPSNTNNRSNNKLYAGFWEQKDSMTYAGYDDGVLIELDFDYEDILSVECNSVTLSKFKFVRVVSESEYKKGVSDVPFLH